MPTAKKKKAKTAYSYEEYAKELRPNSLREEEEERKRKESLYGRGRLAFQKANKAEAATRLRDFK